MDITLGGLPVPLVAPGVTKVGAAISANGVGTGVADVGHSAVSYIVGVDSSKKQAVADVTSGTLTLVQLGREPTASPRKMLRNHLRLCWNMLVVWLATVQKSCKTTSVINNIESIRCMG